MSEIHLTHASFGTDSTEPRNRFHQTALSEARVATEYRQLAPEPATRPSFTTRLRLAFVGGPPVTTEACNCPA